MRNNLTRYKKNLKPLEQYSERNMYCVHSTAGLTLSEIMVVSQLYIKVKKHDISAIPVHIQLQSPHVSQQVSLSQRFHRLCLAICLLIFSVIAQEGDRGGPEEPRQGRDRYLRVHILYCISVYSVLTTVTMAVLRSLSRPEPDLFGWSRSRLSKCKLFKSKIKHFMINNEQIWVDLKFKNRRD